MDAPTALDLTTRHLHAMAHAVHRACADVVFNRHGAKVLIAEVHQRMCANGYALSLLEFKALLWRAHRAGRLQLVRVDMPRMFNADALRDSELCVDGASNFAPLGWSATYHAVIDTSYRWDTSDVEPAPACAALD